MNRWKFYLLLQMFAVLAFGSVSFAQEFDREAFKAELRAELKAELKEELLREIKEELKAEILKETKADVQKATEEVTLGLRDVLRSDFKDQLRAEIMEETRGDISSEIEKALADTSIMDGLFKGITVSGFVDINYFYNLALHGDEDTRQNSLSPLNFVGENENNSLTFESFALFLDKEVTDEDPIGFQMHTYFGEKAKRITFFGETSGRTVTDSAGDTVAISGSNDPDRDDIFTVATANISWKAPIGKGVTFTVGKMYTWIGLELVENIANPNYSHGMIYNNAIPFSHTGISASYDITDTFKVSLYGVNGWDSFIDNNESKSAGWYLAWQPTDKFFISLGGIHGAEGWDNDAGTILDEVGRRDSNGGTTHLIDVVATWQTPHDPLTLMINADWGVAEDAAMRDIDRDGFVTAGGPDIATGGTGHWWGIAGYALYDFTDRFQGVVRYEYFDDTDGVRFFDQSIWEVTVTANIKVRENLLIRPEYRHNDYSRAISTGFSKGVSTDKRNDQEDILGVGVEYLF